MQALIKYKNVIIIGLLVISLSVLGVFYFSNRLDRSQLVLTLHDGFDSADSLSTNWNSYEKESFRYCGYYSDTQLSIKDGKLIISLADVVGFQGQYLYSAAVDSKLSQTYGYFEVKATLPAVNDFYATIALSNANVKDGTDPAQGAKVVFGSSRNNPYPFLDSGIYYDIENGGGVQKNPFVLAFLYGQSHTFGVLWTESSYTFYLDDNKVYESTGILTSTQAMNIVLSFEFPFYTEKDTTGIHYEFSIDEVNIYQFK
jgi:hypothetical protein